MMWTSNKALRLPDVIAGPDREFAASVIEGLSKPRKSLPCRFFYDARGSELFEEITRLPEYYPTRTEIAILDAHAAEIASRVDDGAVLVEFGSGSSRKTEILLSCLPRLRAYVPIDVSESALEEAKRRLIKRFPALAVRPIAGDFSRLLALPPDLAKARKLGFFPGSTIGNFSPFAARTLLGAMRRLLAPDGWLIVGVDLKKDARKLVRAYNDAAGVTAAFNLNLLDADQPRARRLVRSRWLPPRGDLRSPRGPRRDAHCQYSESSGANPGPVVSIFCRRNHPYRELLQIFDRPISRYLLLGGMAAGPRLDRWRKSLQRA